MYPILTHSPLFRGLSAEVLNELFDKVNHRIKSFHVGELLAQSGEPVDRAMLLLQGRLQGEMVDFAGNSLKIEELEPPQMVAAAFLYGPDSRFPVFLTARTEGKMVIILKKDFTDMLTIQPQVMINYLNIVSGKAQFLSNKITFLSLKTIREKIAFFLTQKIRVTGKNTIEMQMTQTGLAELFGVTRPSLTRTILEMEHQGLLTWSREQVSVPDPSKLNEILGR